MDKKKNVTTPNRPMQGTRLRHFIASGGKPSDYKACKGSNAGCEDVDDKENDGDEDDK